MSSIKLSTCATMATAAVAAGFSISNPSYAEGSSWFNPFSYSRSSPENEPKSDDKTSPAPASNSADDESSGRSSGFDPDALERAAKALREMNSSSYSKDLYRIMRAQEKTRLAELENDKLMMELHQIKRDIEGQQNMAEEQRRLVEEQSRVLAQVKREEDKMARDRMQREHEKQRQNNVEMIKMQEEAAIRQEQEKQKTEEQIQARQRQTEKERAKIEQETLRVKAMAEAEARVHEAKLTEDYNKNILRKTMDGEKDKWLAAINTTFSHIEGGLRELLNDRRKLFMTVGGVTALAAGVYTTREGARVSWGYINRILGQPSLIRESSMSKFPWSAVASRRKQNLFSSATSSGEAKGSTVRSGFDNVVLHPSLQRRIEQLARATSNTKAHQAPFRNMLFYGPPGTGKTLVAREIARKSGLDYAMMTGGDVAPLGPQAVTKIHEIFDWAKNSKKGLLLFIDEADAFLCERNSTYMSEAQRSALNALLFRTGDQSRDIVLVLATNRPGDLDSAVTDRIDDVIEFPLPGEEERYKLLNLYLNKYISDENKDDTKSKWGPVFKIRKKPQSITIKDLSEDVIREAARKTEGFSGREIAKLMASVQAAVYGRPDCTLDSQLFNEIVDYKVSEHHQRIKLAAESVQPA
ncbi:ATPase family AAA domain-containing protein 3-like isoform X1 [Chenopodium quinoa]|uniref:AAA+ ATPase domain-containing protein n=2 Tax=Chenopodium quinoa TaxID=63459 RepID=A0A803KYF4_CHEQI|nr:ATPase family AAA domain-containing protein 3-like isoform X1 [Chenopodium quinoa]